MGYVNMLLGCERTLHLPGRADMEVDIDCVVRERFYVVYVDILCCEMWMWIFFVGALF